MRITSSSTGLRKLSFFVQGAAQKPPVYFAGVLGVRRTSSINMVGLVIDPVAQI